MNPWFWLGLAILFEVGGTTALKMSFGLTKMTPSILTFFFYFISFYSLSIALKTLEISVAYSIWAGMGTALIAFLGVTYLHESLSIIKVISIIFIILGVIGLNFSIKSH